MYISIGTSLNIIIFNSILHSGIAFLYSYMHMRMYTDLIFILDR